MKLMSRNKRLAIELCLATQEATVRKPLSPKVSETLTVDKRPLTIGIEQTNLSSHGQAPRDLDGLQSTP